MTHPLTDAEREEARRLAEYVDAFWSRVDKGEGCWEWRGPVDRKGYGHFAPRRGMPTTRVHRIAWMITHNQAVPNGLFVCHACNNRRCVNPAHLYAGTHQENMRDRRMAGREARGDRNGSRARPETRPRGERNWAHRHPEAMRGELNGNARLTSQQVRDIRAAAAAGRTLNSLAREFGVSQTTITKIVRTELWKSVS